VLPRVAPETFGGIQNNSVLLSLYKPTIHDKRLEVLGKV
jgi:hypothetical protein